MRKLLLASVLLFPFLAYSQNVVGPISSNSDISNILVTPSGGIQQKLGDALAAPTGNTSGGNVTATGSTTARTSAIRASDVINIADYGAKCDGTTNDNAAINAAFLAASTSTAYLADTAVVVTGPSGRTSAGCVMNALNATIFQRANGSNLGPRVTIRDMTLICQGTGNNCIDRMGSKMVKLENISIKGAFGGQSPETCIQMGILAYPGASAAWKTAPTSLQIEGIRRNQAAFYGISGVQ